MGSDEELSLALGDGLVVHEGLVEVEEESVLGSGRVMQVGRGAGLEELDVPGGPVGAGEACGVEL